jgi:cohesin complex subunit SCC1
LAAPAGGDIPNPGLNMPDLLAEPLEIPALDESLFNTQALNVDFGSNDNDPLNWQSQLFSDPLNIEGGRNALAEKSELYEDDLGIDIDEGPSIEVGRDAAAPLSDRADDTLLDGNKLYDDDLGLDLGDNTALPTAEGADVEPPLHDDDMDLDIADDAPLNLEGTPAPEGRDRQSESPLSSARSSEVREFEDASLVEEPSVARAKQPAKKRKLLQADAETTIPNSKIKDQQENRAAILKPMSFLPKDPLLLTLMNMQKNGGFVSNIMGDGRGKGWAPELRGILSIEVVRKSGQLKRKRDSAIAGLGQDDDAAFPQLEIPEDEDQPFQQDESIVDVSRNDPSAIIDLPADNDIQQLEDAGLVAPSDPIEPYRDNFDETTAPLVHPEEQGPVSQGTQHAVHLLRDRFGGSAAEGSQNRANVLFSDLLPEATTSKADATKMFFEVLVLATKDAVKVDQPEGSLGGPIRVRPKRGLWGSWAEREAGGEIAEQAEQQAA